MGMNIPLRQADTEHGHDPGAGIASHLRLAFDLLDLGILLASPEAHLLFANRAARRLLHLRKGLFVAAGRVRAETAEATERLHSRIGAVTQEPAGAGPAAAAAVALPTTGGRPVTALVIGCHADLMAPQARRAAIMFVGDPGAEPEVDESYVASAYDLTPAETRLLRSLLTGKRLADCAREVGVTLFTAKGYLKQIFSKTGATRQADLIRLVLADPVLRLLARRRTGFEDAR
jgi:DNA-binding CsgD family transcriptional regulator